MSTNLGHYLMDAPVARWAPSDTAVKIRRPLRPDRVKHEARRDDLMVCGISPRPAHDRWGMHTWPRPTLLGNGAAVHRQCHGRTYHRDHGLSRCGPQTVSARPLVRTFLTELTVSVATQFGPRLSIPGRLRVPWSRESRSTQARLSTPCYAEPRNGEESWCGDALRRPS